MSDLTEIVPALAREAGDIALGHFRKLSGSQVEAKGHLDLLTVADREVEQFLARRLSELFPEDGLFGEEGSRVAGTSGRVWVIDPIDGTFNFVRGAPDWAVSIGLVENGRPVFGVAHAPVHGDTFSGGAGQPARCNGTVLAPRPAYDPARAAIAVGIHPTARERIGREMMTYIVDDLGVAFRNYGSAVIGLMQVARGYIDGYLGAGVASWDVAGMLPVVEQLGITSTIDWQGAGLFSGMDFIIGTPELIRQAPPLPRGRG